MKKFRNKSPEEVIKSPYAVHMKNLATKAQRHKIFTKYMFFLVKPLCLRVFVANLSFLRNVNY